MDRFDERVLRLAGQQHFVVGRRQLLEFGTVHQIRRRLSRGTLERVHEASYRIAHSPVTWQQQLMAACFAGGKSSVASFRAAAQLYALPGGQEIVEVTSPRHRRARHPGIVPHESRHLTDLDITYVDNIPVTRVARTLNDLGLLVELGQLEASVLDHAMHDAFRRDLVDLRRVWREWERLGGAIRPGSAAVENMLRTFVPPIRRVDSSPEIRLLQLIREAGLPEPVAQHRVWISATSWYDLDFAWPSAHFFAEFDPYKYHGDRDKYQRDAARRLRIRALGWDGVSVTDDELDSGALLAIAVLRQLFETAVHEGRR
jgi:hypothetical protein